MKEKQYEDMIKAHLKSLPNTWFYKNWGGGYGVSGIPDIIACVNGVFVAIEVKSTKGKASALQERNIKLIREAGGIAEISYPEDWETLKKSLTVLSGKNEESVNKTEFSYSTVIEKGNMVSVLKYNGRSFTETWSEDSSGIHSTESKCIIVQLQEAYGDDSYDLQCLLEEEDLICIMKYSKGDEV